MDYNNYHNPSLNPNRCVWMENISIILGIVAILSSWAIYPALICGSMAIVFALLSKGGERSITAKARCGLILGFIALAIMVCIVSFAASILLGIYGDLSNLPVDSYGDLDTGTLINDLYAYFNIV